MGRLRGADAIKEAVRKYSGSSVNFFQLKNDGDSAKVIFLHGGDDDLDIFVVHKVKTAEDREVHIECLEGDCPLCESGHSPKVIMYLYLLNTDTGQIELWERGPAMVQDILGFIEKYGALKNRPWEIVRRGKKGDNKTKYQFFPEDQKDLKVLLEKAGFDEIPQRPDVTKHRLRVMTAEEISDFLAENQGSERPRGKRDSLGF